MASQSLISAAPASLSVLLVSNAWGQCFPQWDTSIGLPGGLPGPVHAVAVYDDGTGCALYVGGFPGVGLQTRTMHLLALVRLVARLE
jgi:hypothetical protein